jgi:hypothetical protein
MPNWVLRYAEMHSSPVSVPRCVTRVLLLPSPLLCMCLVCAAQGVGAPACATILTSWFAAAERGTYWGMWNIAHNLGGFLAPVIVGEHTRLLCAISASAAENKTLCAGSASLCHSKGFERTSACHQSYHHASSTCPLAVDPQHVCPPTCRVAVVRRQLCQELWLALGHVGPWAHRLCSGPAGACSCA